MFHHCRDLERVAFDVVSGAPVRDTLPEPECRTSMDCDRSDDWHDRMYYEAAYAWLAEQVGFWPTFLGVGAGYDAWVITGYDRQWMRRDAPTPPRSRVLMSWERAPEGCVFTDYMAWHVVLGSIQWEPGHRLRVRGIGDPIRRSVLKPSWRTSDWLRFAARNPGWVQAVVPSLDLRTADTVWCRNRAARAELVRRGFAPERVAVRRIPVLR